MNKECIVSTFVSGCNRCEWFSLVFVCYQLILIADWRWRSLLFSLLQRSSGSYTSCRLTLHLGIIHNQEWTMDRTLNTTEITVMILGAGRGHTWSSGEPWRQKLLLFCLPAYWFNHCPSLLKIYSDGTAYHSSFLRKSHRQSSCLWWGCMNSSLLQGRSDPIRLLSDPHSSSVFSQTGCFFVLSCQMCLLLLPPHLSNPLWNPLLSREIQGNPQTQLTWTHRSSTSLSQ